MNALIRWRVWAQRITLFNQSYPVDNCPQGHKITMTENIEQKIINIRLSRPQADFVFSKHKYPAIIGGFGSGKSEAGIKRLIHLASQEKGLVLSHSFPTYKLAKRRGLNGYINDLRARGIKPKINKSELTIEIAEYGSKIYLDTYYDPDSIVGYEVAHAVIDELDTLEKESAEYVHQKITERVRQQVKHPIGNTIAVATTPNQGESGFCFKRWGRGEFIADGYHYIRAGSASNKFLPVGYVEQIAANYDPVMANAFIHGEWVNFAKNKVYSYFNRAKHHIDRYLDHADYYLHVGQDFNIGGCVSTVFVIDTQGNPIAVDEFVSHDTRDLIIKLTSIYQPLPTGKRHISIYPDASGNSNKTSASASDIELLRQAGFTVHSPTRNPLIRDRVNAVNGLLAHDRFKINTIKCKHLTHALESQGYDDNGQPEKSNNHPAIDDYCDSASYLLSYKYPVQGSIQTPVFRGI